MGNHIQNYKCKIHLLKVNSNITKFKDHTQIMLTYIMLFHPDLLHVLMQYPLSENNNFSPIKHGEKSHPFGVGLNRGGSKVRKPKKRVRS